MADTSKDWRDALRLHSDLTRKVISEQTRLSQSFDYLRLYLFAQVWFLLQEKTDEHLAHLRRRHQAFKVHHLEETLPDPAWSDEPTQVHRVAEDSTPSPPSSGVTPALTDDELEINIFGEKVSKTSPTWSHCGFKRHKVKQTPCRRKHPL